MELLAHARITIWEGASLWRIDALQNTARARQRTDVHAHHAIQIVLGLGGTFRLDTAAGHYRDKAVAVAADAPHWFEAEGRFALLFIEPESRAGRAISQALFTDGTMATVDPVMVADFCRALMADVSGDTLDDPTVAELGRDLIGRLAGAGVAIGPDWRVRRMIAHAAGHVDGPVAIADVVAACGLSASRLSHIFVEQTGLPFRTYLLWLRLTQAVGAITGGCNLTEAAHQAGFADSAHFSRTFRKMFGIAPASLRMT